MKQRNNLVEIVEKQEAVINIQGGIINDLFRLLSEHLSAEELDTLPAVGKINTAAGIRQDISRLMCGWEAGT